jgi:hypothetical protein
MPPPDTRFPRSNSISLSKEGDGFGWAIALMIASSAIAYTIIRRAGVETPALRKRPQ